MYRISISYLVILVILSISVILEAAVVVKDEGRLSDGKSKYGRFTGLQFTEQTWLTGPFLTNLEIIDK